MKPYGYKQKTFGYGEGIKWEGKYVIYGLREKRYLKKFSSRCGRRQGRLEINRQLKEM